MTSTDSSPGSDSSRVVFTPAGSSSPLPSTSRSPVNSTKPIRLTSLPEHVKADLKPENQKERQDGEYYDDEASGDESDHSDMSERPRYQRSALSQTPLLTEDKRGRSDDSHGSQRPPFAARRDTFRSKSPTYPEPEELTRRKYIYASFFLLVCLVSFVVQTETAVYIQHTLHWDKAYCMLWLTHGSWSFLWPVQLLILRIQNRKLSWSTFWRQHKQLVRSTAQMVVSQDLHLSPTTSSRSPWWYMIKTTAGVTTFLTMAGGSWYIAVNLTTPSDLTAIYNCSAFFAYVFSILLLHDKVRLDKVISVGLAVLGVLVVAYGDKAQPKHGSHSGGATNPNKDEPPDNRALGNILIGIGSVMYGLYEVLYKKYACPPDGTAPNRGMIFANTFGSMIGCFTVCVLWIPIPILHYTGLETFELPRGKVAGLLAISTLSNATFSGAFLVLMSLTSPVLSSVAALLTIFLVAITDWLLTGDKISKAAIAGGLIIIVAFLLLSWATYREMKQEEREREREERKPFDVEDLDADLNDSDLEDDARYDPHRGRDSQEVDELGRRSRRESSLG